MTQVREFIDAVQRGNLEAYEAWLKNVPWQLFCTFTFAWPVSDQQALKVFGEFMSRLERSIRGPITFVRGDEKRYSGCGMPGAPRHFHVLIAAHRRLDRHFVGDLWMSVAGHRTNGAGADTRIYDPQLEGIAYVLKLMNHALGDWNFKNLDLFLDQSNDVQMNHRKRRRIARHAKRLQS